MEAKLRQWDARLEEAEHRAASATEDVRASLARRRAELGERREALRARIAEARASAGEGWERVSRELEEAWDAFRASAGEVTEALRD